ncbi:MAG TPA: heparinase II/III family protein, partial [Gemmatimonadales bacterium]|nr:heparinase II/III family protein [Gemmatimonadales bacterium]
SVWLTSYLAAGSLLKESGHLAEDVAEGVGVVAEEAANLIGEFDEGFSNRQTWHNAALAAIAVWFEDEDLLHRAVQGPTGMLPHLVEGFGSDGMWYEGENYHLFALRGQLVGMGWAREAGIDLLEDERLAARLGAALRAPALTALPDHTFPARKDSRFAMSLAQPMYLELWEVGLARLGDEGSDLWSWLRELYAAPAPKAETFDSYLHEAGESAPAARTRADLSWWALLEMAPALPDGAPWEPGPVLLEGQGLAVLRTADRYASLECGRLGGGHGHPDRLHLTLFADGVHWLADPGTGSYVTGDLFWYRSTLAHNAPRLDRRSQPPGDARCEAFDVQGGWSWTRGRYGEMARTLVAGDYLLDVVELDAAEDRTIELPWHLAGRVEMTTPGDWTAEPWDEPFIERAERFTGRTEHGVMLRSHGENGATLTLHLHFDGTLLRAGVPGRPGQSGRGAMYLVRARGRGTRFVAVLETGRGAARVRSVDSSGDLITVETAEGADRHLAGPTGWEITGAAGTTRLGGLRRAAAATAPLIDLNRPTRAAGAALYVQQPELDGTLDAFDASEPMTLDYDDQYRRSEEPYHGPEEFSATLVANWNEDALYLGVDVVKAEVIVRPDDAPPLRLDNEPDDIHADGLQVYLRPEPDGPIYGFLVVPSEAGGVRVHAISDTAASPGMVTGAWQPTGTGYSMVLGIALPDWSPRGGDTLGFDLIVNEMHPDRLRRAGQLVWSGGGGWVYLRGDRQPPESFGTLELR